MKYIIRFVTIYSLLIFKYLYIIRKYYLYVYLYHRHLTKMGKQYTININNTIYQNEHM
jgi:hypothetical protein